MIKTVIFDLGNVIVPLDFPKLYRAMAEHCPVQPDDIPKRIGETGLVPLLETGQMESGEFTARIAEHLKMRLPADGFRDLWFSLFHPHTLIPDSLVEKIASNYRLLLLSNTNSLHFEMIAERYSILRHFHDLILSYKVGAMKPSPAIYEAALAKANCQPEECFFTDDILDYVKAARTAGFQAVQFLSHEQLLLDLDGLGIQHREMV
jgi:FMN phosphatase YigB (HAD superfamily)